MKTDTLHTELMNKIAMYCSLWVRETTYLFLT